MLSFTTLGWQSGYEVLNPGIEVHYGPSFTIKREPQFGIPILQGMTVMLGCDVDANPVMNSTGKAIYNRLLNAVPALGWVPWVSRYPCIFRGESQNQWILKRVTYKSQ